jgi:hypothetical protein
MDEPIKGIPADKFAKWFEDFKQRTREALVLGAMLFIIATILMILSILLFRDKLTVMGITLVFGLSGIFCASGAGIIAAGAITNMRTLAEMFNPNEPEKKDT